jgi:chromosome partitioning protein
MRILALVNQKGGCGKTTTALHLASCLSAMGRRTLLIDLDPQGHSTLGLGVPLPERERSLTAALSTSGLEEWAVPLGEILTVIAPDFYLAPSGAELTELESSLARTSGGEERLAEHLAPLTNDFDRVILDAPPSLGMLTLNALMAAHEAIVPMEPSLYSLHGLARLVELTRLLSGHSRHEIRFRVLLNCFDCRTRFAKQILEEVRRTFPGQTLETIVRSSIRVREAAVRGKPVDRFAPNSPIARDYRSLAAELEEEISLEAAVADTAAPGLVATREGVYLTRKDIDPERVCLAGDFNGWVPDSGVILEMQNGGRWTKFIPLRPGRYEYKLVIDGRWLPDPLNPKQIANGVGSVNSVLDI